MIAANSWKDEHIELLKVWWEKGYTSNNIAHRFSEVGYKVTRNAVIGKVHRLGLCGRRTQKDKPAPQRTIQLQPKKVPRPVVPFRTRHPSGFYIRRGRDDVIEKPNPANQVSLLETQEDHCRAIIGYRDGKASEAVCCGGLAVWVLDEKGRKKRSPWCKYHNHAYTSEGKR